MKRLAMVLLGVIGGCTMTPDLDPGNLEIDINRNYAIMESVHEIAFQVDGRSSVYPESVADMNAMLRANVWKYNLERETICLHGYLPKYSCGPPYVPAWMNETSDVAPSLAVLRARATEFGVRVEAFWDAACAEAERRLEHDDWFALCSIE